MQFKIIFFLLIFSNSICFAQIIDTSAISLLASWSVGETYNFSVKKMRKVLNVDKYYDIDSTSYVAKFEVLSSTDTTYQIKWSFKTDLKAFGVPEEFTPQFSQYDTTNIIYTTTTDGTFIEIENWEEISSRKTALLNQVLNTLVENQNTTMRGSKIRTLKQLYNSKNANQFSVFRELYYFHNFFAKSYKPSDTISITAAYKFKILPKLIEGESKTFIDSVNVDQSFIRIVKKLNYNPDAFKHFATTLLKDKKYKKYKKLYNKKDVKNSKLRLYDFLSYEFNLKKGIPIKITLDEESFLEFKDSRLYDFRFLEIDLID